jgi:uncharacterized protein (DUF433 family)
VTTATIDISELLEVEPRRGRVVVRGTKIGVQRIIGLHLEGRSADEISTAFKGLSLGAVYAANLTKRMRLSRQLRKLQRECSASRSFSAVPSL